VITAVAADDLEGVPVATLPTALHEVNRLAPHARRNAVPRLTSLRNRGIAVVPMRTSGNDMRKFSAQLDPPQ